MIDPQLQWAGLKFKFFISSMQLCASLGGVSEERRGDLVVCLRNRHKRVSEEGCSAVAVEGKEMRLIRLCFETKH